MTFGNLVLLFFLLISVQALDYHDKSFLSLSRSSPTFLQHSRLGKIILSFSQLSSKESDFSGLFDALDLLLASLQDQILSENTTYVSSQTLHQSAVETLSNLISQTKLQAETAQDTLTNTLSPSKEEIETQIEDISQSILDFYSRKTELEDERTSQQAKNSQEIFDFTEAINAVEDAISILRVLSVSGSGGVSFVQRKYEDLSQAKNLLKLSVSRVKHGFYINTLVQALSFLGEKNFIDQDALTRVLNLLKELRDSFETEKKNIADYDDQQQILYENSLQSIEDGIEAQTTSLNLAKTQLNDVNCKNLLFFKNSYFLFIL